MGFVIHWYLHSYFELLSGSWETSIVEEVLLAFRMSSMNLLTSSCVESKENIQRTSQVGSSPDIKEKIFS